MQLNDERGAMLDLMLRAYLLALSSGLRLYERGMHLYAEHSARVTSESTQGVLIDELRAWARELAELQSQETRLFVQQLDELIRQVSSASGDARGDVWKRWKVKP
jgi:hypothetical protein